MNRKGDNIALTLRLEAEGSNLNTGGREPVFPHLFPEIEFRADFRTRTNPHAESRAIGAGVRTTAPDPHETLYVQIRLKPLGRRHRYFQLTENRLAVLNLCNLRTDSDLHVQMAEICHPGRVKLKVAVLTVDHILLAASPVQRLSHPRHVVAENLGRLDEEVSPRERRHRRGVDGGVLLEPCPVCLFSSEQ